MKVRSDRLLKKRREQRRKHKGFHEKTDWVVWNKEYHISCKNEIKNIREAKLITLILWRKDCCNVLKHNRGKDADNLSNGGLSELEVANYYSKRGHVMDMNNRKCESGNTGYC